MKNIFGFVQISSKLRRLEGVGNIGEYINWKVPEYCIPTKFQNKLFEKDN